MNGRVTIGVRAQRRSPSPHPTDTDRTILE